MGFSMEPGSPGLCTGTGGGDLDIHAPTLSETR